MKAALRRLQLLESMMAPPGSDLASMTSAEREELIAHSGREFVERVCQTKQLTEPPDELRWRAAEIDWRAFYFGSEAEKDAAIHQMFHALYWHAETPFAEEVQTE